MCGGVTVYMFEYVAAGDFKCVALKAASAVSLFVRICMKMWLCLFKEENLDVKECHTSPQAS